MQRILAVVLFFLVAISVSAQTPELDKLIKVNATTAPDASAFQKYINYPVDYSSGVPNITFPLWNVKSINLSIPITLSYHASGIKVEEVAGAVGLGFSLNLGGRISHTIIDKDDMEPTFQQPITYKTPEQYNAAANDVIYGQNYNLLDYHLEELANTLWYEKTYVDRIADRFSLSLPNGTNVTFRRDFFSGEFKQIPYKGLKIEYKPLGVSGFRVTDTDGTTYLFEDVDNRNAGWNLTKIIAANQTNYISLNYGITQSNGTTGYPTQTYNSGEGLHLSYNSDTRGGWVQLVTNPFGASSVSGFDLNQNNLVSSIETSTERISFTYSGGRLDPGSAKLDRIIVIDKLSGREVRKVAFTYNYFGSSATNNRRLKLESFKMFSEDLPNAEVYSFNYNEAVVLPPYYNMVSHREFHEDFWGYYNGLSSTGNIPMEAVSGGSSLSNYVGNRYPNEFYAKACLLKEVRYPSGGKTAYEFESNSGVIYTYPFYTPANNIAGGLRIKAIKHYSSSNQLAEFKTYEYEGNCYAEVISYDRYVRNQRYYVPLGNTPSGGWSIPQKVAMSDPMESLISVSGSSVFYRNVREFIGSSSGINGYTEYRYSMPERQEYMPIEFSNPAFKHAFQWDYGSETPLLDSTLIYRKSGTDLASGLNKYDLVKVEANTYERMKQNKFATGINFVETTIYRSSNGTLYNYFWDVGWGQGNAYTPADDELQPGFSQYVDENGGAGMETYPAQAQRYFDFIRPYQTYAYEASHLLTSKTEKDYSSGGVISKKTDYLYDSNHLLLSTETTTDSEGNSLKTEYKYPFSEPFDIQAPYNSMLSKNMVSPVIERISYKNGTYLNTYKTNYDYWGAANWTNSSSHIVPRSVELKKLDNNSEVRVRYHMYNDRGSVASLSKEQGPKISYIWGYGDTYAIAEITNSDLKNVYYTGFEDVVLNGIVEGGKTGRKSKTGDFSVTLHNLDNQNYNLSYWVKFGGSWSFVKSIVSVSSGEYRININGQVDDVKFYPVDAQMTTYTYDPLVGITSSTDAADRVTYYDYDSLNRLITVRNRDAEIIKKIGYNYPSQGETQNVRTAAYWVATGEGRCQPCPSNGSFVTSLHERQEKDINAESPSYGNVRWIADGVTSECESNSTFQASYQNTSTPPRCIMINGAYTGYQEQEQRNVNPCSATYNETRWVLAGLNTSACPATFYSIDKTGSYYSTSCSAGNTPNAYHVSIPAGMFTSTISLDDANLKAINYGQLQANVYGGCQYVGVELRFDLSSYSGNSYYVELTNTITNEYFSFELSAGSSGIAGYVPEGTYDVALNNYGSASDACYVGCSGGTNGTGSHSRSGITINSSCNLIQITSN